jgi:hypothetical protein
MELEKRKILLVLTIDLVLIGDERQHKIVKPLGDAISPYGKILMSLPTYKVNADGDRDREWDIISLDIVMTNLSKGINSLRRGLKELDLLESSDLKFKLQDYNLLRDLTHPSVEN